MKTPGRTDDASSERYALACQRTALSLVVCAAIMARLTWSELGAPAAGPLAAAAVLSGWVFWESRLRYARDRGPRSSAAARSGRVPAALTAAVALIAVTGLAARVAATYA